MPSPEELSRMKSRRTAEKRKRLRDYEHQGRTATAFALPAVRSVSQPVDVEEPEPVEPEGRRWSWQNAAKDAASRLSAGLTGKRVIDK